MTERPRAPRRGPRRRGRDRASAIASRAQRVDPPCRRRRPAGTSGTGRRAGGRRRRPPAARHVVRGQGQHRRRRRPHDRGLRRVRVHARPIVAGGRAARERRRALRGQDQPRPVRHRAGRHPRHPTSASAPIPFDPAYIAGGSSSGSAVAVATGMVTHRARHRHRRLRARARGVLRDRRAEAHPRAARARAGWSPRRAASTASRPSRPRAPTPPACSASRGARATSLAARPHPHAGGCAERPGVVRRPRRAGLFDAAVAQLADARRRDGDHRSHRLPRRGTAPLRQRAGRRTGRRVRRVRRRASRRDGSDRPRGGQRGGAPPGDRRRARVRAARGDPRAHAADLGRRRRHRGADRRPPPARRGGAPRSVRSERRARHLHELREPARPVRGGGAGGHARRRIAVRRVARGAGAVRSRSCSRSPRS